MTRSTSTGKFMTKFLGFKHPRLDCEVWCWKNDEPICVVTPFKLVWTETLHSTGVTPRFGHYLNSVLLVWYDQGSVWHPVWLHPAFVAGPKGLQTGSSRRGPGCAGGPHSLKRRSSRENYPPTLIKRSHYWCPSLASSFCSRILNNCSGPIRNGRLLDSHELKSGIFSLASPGIKISINTTHLKKFAKRP